MTTVPGIANAAVGLATDIQSRYLDKLLTMPVSIGSIMAGRRSATARACSSRPAPSSCPPSPSAPRSRNGVAGALLCS